MIAGQIQVYGPLDQQVPDDPAFPPFMRRRTFDVDRYNQFRLHLRRELVIIDRNYNNNFSIFSRKIIPKHDLKFLNVISVKFHQKFRKIIYFNLS